MIMEKSDTIRIKEAVPRRVFLSILRYYCVALNFREFQHFIIADCAIVIEQASKSASLNDPKHVAVRSHVTSVLLFIFFSQPAT